MPKRESSWYEKAADLMSKSGISLIQACFELNIPILQSEAEAHFHSDAFQIVLRNARARIYGDVANDPGHNKRTLIGKLLFSAERLMEKGAFDKAAEVLHKIAKVEGWDQSNTNLTVIGDLTQKDLDDLKRKLHDEYGPTVSSPGRA